MINVIFAVKCCSSSPVLRALLMGVGRMEVLGAFSAPGAGAQLWLWPHPLSGQALVGTAHAQGSDKGHSAFPDTQGCHPPGQAHARHISITCEGSSHITASQMKMSKPPAPRENPQRLCKAGLAPRGQTHPSQASQKGAPSSPLRALVWWHSCLCSWPWDWAAAPALLAQSQL